MIHKCLALLVVIPALLGMNVQAGERYSFDIEGMHAFITFRVQHLGFSWLEGRFNRFSGTFDYDEANPENNHVEVEIDVASLDSNHAERDKHLRSERFFDVKKHPKATFVSTGWQDRGEGRATLNGKFTLRGATKDIAIEVRQIGAGPDPWGGYRRGFEGKVGLKLSDYDMRDAPKLGPAAENIEIWISIEGIRQ